MIKHIVINGGGPTGLISYGVLKHLHKEEYFNIEGGSVPVAGYQPRAIIKSSDVPYISQEDRLVVDRLEVSLA